MNQSNWPRAVPAVALVACGMWIGANLSTTSTAQAEVSATPEPLHFQAGSVPILRDISGTLRQMDARLARLEVAAQKMQSAAVRGAVKATARDNGVDN